MWIFYWTLKLALYIFIVGAVAAAAELIPGGDSITLAVESVKDILVEVDCKALFQHMFEVTRNIIAQVADATLNNDQASLPDVIEQAESLSQEIQNLKEAQ